MVITSLDLLILNVPGTKATSSFCAFYTPLDLLILPNASVGIVCIHVHTKNRCMIFFLYYPYLTLDSRLSSLLFFSIFLSNLHTTEINYSLKNPVKPFGQNFFFFLGTYSFQLDLKIYLCVVFHNAWKHYYIYILYFIYFHFLFLLLDEFCQRSILLIGWRNQTVDKPTFNSPTPQLTHIWHSLQFSQKFMESITSSHFSSFIGVDFGGMSAVKACLPSFKKLETKTFSCAGACFCERKKQISNLDTATHSLTV